jgi:hypothetical protein
MRTTPAPARRRRVAAALLGATVLIGAFAGTASAKEIGSGGGTTTSTACSPVTSLSYKGDTTTSDSAAATVKVSYGAKSCTKAPVTASLTIFQSAVPSNVIYADPNAPLNGKITVGVLANTSYQARVDVFDAATGTKVGSQTIYVAAVRKTGV